MQNKIYFAGYIGLNFLFEDSENSKLPHWTSLSLTKIRNVDKIHKIISNEDGHCIVWKGNNQIEFYEKYELTQFFGSESFGGEEIQDIYSGCQTFLILTRSGKVFSLAECNYSNEIPLEDPDESNYQTIRPVPFFNDKKNNRTVQSITMGGWSNYFICTDGTLYANGNNEDGSLGDGTNVNKQIPVFIAKNVLKTYSGKYSNSCFFTNTNNELYGCGYNSIGQLGIINQENQNKPYKVQDWKASDILDIYCSGYNSYLITQAGKAYSCGVVNREKGAKYIFTEIPELKTKRVVQMDGGNHIILMLTSENELYGCGFNNTSHPTKQYLDIESGRWNRIKKINLPTSFQNNIDPSSIKINISCGAYSIFLYSSCNENDCNNIEKIEMGQEKEKEKKKKRKEKKRKRKEKENEKENENEKEKEKEK